MIRLPPDTPQRANLHNELHSRPTPLIPVPALVFYVAVLNQGVSREQELAHLQGLPRQDHLAVDDLRNNFLHLRFADFNLRWERHTEFTRYTLMQPLPDGISPDAPPADISAAITLPDNWMAEVPGQTILAVELVMLTHAIEPAAEVVEKAHKWFGGHSIVASRMGNLDQDKAHSLVLSDLQLNVNGIERILVLLPASTSPGRAGRIAQRLLEVETYRMMALLGLPVAKTLTPMLAGAEEKLAHLTQKIPDKNIEDRDLLEELTQLAADVEQAIALNGYRFSATHAYDTLVHQRLDELRERPIFGTQTLGEFMQRRYTPAIATVQAADKRLELLSERIDRSSDLLRTRVDIVTEAQNQQLLEKLTRGQALQLQLQSMVEGLSIAAISYYVVSLVHYGAEAAEGLGLHINPDTAAGLSIPLVLFGVWRAVRHIHHKMFGHLNKKSD